MKVLQLIDSLSIGGAERMAVNMANAFIDNNIDNVLVCARKTGPLEKYIPEETRFFELKKASSFDLFAFIKLIRIIKAEKPEIIHAHSTSIYWGIALKFFRPSTKLIWHDHDGLSENLKDSDRKLLRWLSSSINGVVAVNDILKKWSLRNMKVKNIVFIRNFPYTKNLNPTLRRDKNVILHIANLRPQKDHFTLIMAVKMLKDNTQNSFEVWSAGNDNQDTYSRSVKNMVKEYNLEEEIKFFGGVSDTSALLENATIGILTSQSEGLPVSLLEYGLAALPVIVTNVGQCSEVVGNGKFGVVVSPSNPHELYEALLNYLENKEESINLGFAFQQHVARAYGHQNFIFEYSKFINEL